MNPKMQPVRSKSVAEIGYDPNVRQLHIHFHGSRGYVYHDVPAPAWKRLRDAESVGGHLQRHVVGKYRHTRKPEGG